MKLLVFKTSLKLLTAFFTVFLFVALSRPTYAQNCANYAPTQDDSLNPMHIVCPAVRFINLLLFSAGVIFVIMIFVGSIKYATSFGDPKGAMGANQTLTYAIVGFIAVIAVFTILNLIMNIFGFDIDSLNVFNTIQQRICEVLYNGGDPIVIGINCSGYAP